MTSFFACALPAACCFGAWSPPIGPPPFWSFPTPLMLHSALPGWHQRCALADRRAVAARGSVAEIHPEKRRFCVNAADWPLAPLHWA